MAEHLLLFTNTKHCRGYIDPMVKNGECKVVKPADPKLLEKNKKLIEWNRREVNLRKRFHIK